MKTHQFCCFFCFFKICMWETPLANHLRLIHAINNLHKFGKLSKSENKGMESFLKCLEQYTPLLFPTTYVSYFSPTDEFHFFGLSADFFSFCVPEGSTTTNSAVRWEMILTKKKAPIVYIHVCQTAPPPSPPNFFKPLHLKNITTDLNYKVAPPPKLCSTMGNDFDENKNLVHA